MIMGFVIVVVMVGVGRDHAGRLGAEHLPQVPDRNHGIHAKPLRPVADYAHRFSMRDSIDPRTGAVKGYDKWSP